jgi:3-mercaptopyruvate sulfurtransferase SseA
MRRTRTALVLLVIVLVAVALSGCGEKNGTSPDGSEVAIEQAAIQVAEGYMSTRYLLVDAQGFKDWVDLGEIMTVIDVRPESDYLAGHLPGAVNAEIERDQESSTEQIEAFLALLPENHDSIVVVYDDFTAMNGSHRAGVYAADAGYTKVYRFVGGAQAWIDAGNSLTKD